MYSNSQDDDDGIILGRRVSLDYDEDDDNCIDRLSNLKKSHYNADANANANADADADADADYTVEEEEKQHQRNDDDGSTSSDDLFCLFL